MKQNNLLLALFVIFLVAFPKGGIKAGEIPLTFGYLILAIFALFAGATNIAVKRYGLLHSYSLTAYGYSLPLVVVSALIYAENGTDSVSYAVAFFVGFAGLPFIFFVILAPQLQLLDIEKLHRYITRAVTFCSIYGIVLFAWYLSTGDYFEIPYLTINADDSGQLGLKDNARSEGISKLISTYNNGNIYGVSILMLLPIYDRVQSSSLLKVIVRTSLILTLSRTVWIGLFAYEILSAFYIGPFRRKTMLYFIIGISSVMLAIGYVLSIIGLDATFLFDSNLGGRADIVNNTKWLFLPQDPVSFQSEIIVVNIVRAFGFIGLTAFFLSTLTPIWLSLKSKLRKDRTHRSYVTGMLMLLICGLSDGPILLIPVMAFYWALASISLTRNSTHVKSVYSAVGNIGDSWSHEE